jgi:hypothetical protein
MAKDTLDKTLEQQIFLDYNFEECKVRIIPPTQDKIGQHFIRFYGKQEFIPENGSKLFYVASSRGKKITEEEYYKD